jgi:hypothetical protein
MALLFWIGVFTIYFTAMSTTPIEFFFGRFEEPPRDLGVWKPTGIVSDDGLAQETRCILPGGSRRAPYLVRQVRYRDPSTQQILRVETEQRVKRRRVSTRGSA